MPKIKTPYKKGFTIIDNRFLDDEKLTLRAKGLFVYMWSKGDDWNFYVTELVKHSKCGRDQVMSTLNELEEHGYLLRSRNRNALGQLTNKSIWLLSDTPRKTWIEQKHKKEAAKTKTKKTVKKAVDNSTQPKSEKPTQEKPALGNPTLPITNLTKDLSNQGLTSLSLSKSLPENKKQRTVSKKAAKDYEREEKVNKIIFYLNQYAVKWGAGLTPVSSRERAILAKTIGNRRFEDIKPLIETAAVNAEQYPFGYLVSMIRNLPEALPEANHE